MKKMLTRLRLLAILCVCSYAASAQSNYWKDISESSITTGNDLRKIIPTKFRTLALDTTAMLALLDKAPMEFSAEAKNNPVVLSFPMPDGTISRFNIVKSTIMEAGLHAKFPYFRTLSGQGIDDPYASLKIDWTCMGFRAQILSAITGPIYIDPYSFNSKMNYTSYYKKDLPSKGPFIDEVEEGTANIKNAARTNGVCIGGTLRTYRIAISCTGEYAKAATGLSAPSVAQALSAIVTTNNRVNGVYETEVAVRLVLIANNNIIVFTDPASDPFNGNNAAGTLINESQTQITNRIGTANFDIGHTFSTGGGGLAGLGVVCNASQKGRGITGSTYPVGDPYDIDFVAHEVGHQFGCQHTFNAATGNCSGNGSSTANSEPGSGVTIMAYAGICGATNDLAPNSIAYFNPISFDQLVAFSQTGGGNTCAAQTATGNSAPIVNAGSDYTIPKSTNFELTGSGSDPNGDALTYSWEQFNTGAAFSNWNAPAGEAPIFRAFSPVTSPTRVFPKWINIVNNAVTIGELLPTYARAMKFRLTARDNKAGGGGVCSDEMVVNVNANAGPFLVTNPNTSALSWEAFTSQTVTWDAANTTSAPVSCANVAIELSIDGGYTYPITLVANTPNDGTEQILVPNNVTNFARVRVRAVGNIFFDISNSNFSIIPTTQSSFMFLNTSLASSCDNTNATSSLTSIALGTFSMPINLSATGNPAGSTVVFSSNPINPGDIVSVSLQGAAIPSGVYTISVLGTAGAVQKTQALQFAIGPPTTITALTAPDNVTNGISLLPTFVWQATTGAETYVLDISELSDFSTITQSVNGIAATTYTLTTPLAENTEYYWRISASNICGPGASSDTFLFKTATISCATESNSVGVTIPTTISTVTSTISIPAGGIIADVKVVGLYFYHSYVSDVKFTLISPTGTRVSLVGGICGSQGVTSTNPAKLDFDDAAAAVPACPYNTTAGLAFKPTQPLAALNGQSSTGTWTLEVADTENGDGGKVVNWGLNFCTLVTTPFPVTWLNFSGRKTDQNSVQLNWATTNEINNRYYEIERGINGIEFASIGKINAGNIPSSVQQYYYNDMKPYAGVNYYRLKQIDKDGRFTYSSVVRVITDKKGASFVVYPNPATDVATVRMLSDLKEVSFRLNNAIGQTVFQMSTSAVKTGQEVKIPVKELPKGVYNLTVTNENGRTTEKIVVQ